MPLSYHPLDETINEIRLLELSPTPSTPDGTNTPAHCRIIHTSQQDAPPYSALSYVWGSPTDTVPIAVRQSHVTFAEDLSVDALKIDASDTVETAFVTRSLGLALAHLRAGLAAPMYLWVDALAIDQANNAEKTRQVERMTDIFRCATEVLVWLGEAADGSDELVDVLAEIGREAAALGTEPGFVYQLVRKSREGGSDAGEQDSDGDERAVALTKFLYRLDGNVSGKRPFPPTATNAFINRPWWTRIWVVQEASVARNLVFVCGTKRLEGGLCFLALEALAGYWQKLEKSMLGGSKNATPYQRELMKLYTTQLAIWRMISKANFLDKGFRPSLFELLHWSTSQPGLARMHATDPRDRIFSLLGIARDSLGVRPDYDMSCEEVYTHTSKALLDSGSFEIWYHCQPHKNTVELPSWAVDWSAEFSRTSWRLSRMFKASGETTPSISFEMSGSGVPTTVILKGVQIDRIGRVGPTWKECRDQMHRKNRHSQSISRLWCQMFKATANSNATASTEARETSHIDDAIFRCSKYDFDDETAMFGLTSDELFEGYKELIKITSGFQVDKRQIIVSYSYVVKRNTEFRRPFVTEGGLLGLGLDSVQDGDLVVVFYGANIPFVIRQWNTGDFMLVGGAYVDGLMNGEAIEREHKAREFRIQ